MLSSRKNVPEGSLLKRKCWCDAAQSLLCPVHVIWNYIAKFEVGMQVFAGISPGRTIGTLRHYIGLPEANLYRCHDIRRGHGDDMRASASSLFQILEAGQWKPGSVAFQSYLNLEALETDAALQAALDASSSEEKEC